MNTHFLRTKKASPTIFLVLLTVFSLSFMQPDSVSGQNLLAQDLKSTPDSIKKYQAAAAGGGGGTPLKIDPSGDIFLLQPLDDSTTTISARPGIQIFFDYFNMSWPWVLGVCAGIAVLQAMIGGMQIMMSGGDSGKGEGKERMMWATGGLLVIALAGMILSTINPIFYT